MNMLVVLLMKNVQETSEHTHLGGVLIFFKYKKT